MKLEKRLEKNKTGILKKWFDRLASTYPQDTAKFLKDQKDSFANPVGTTFQDCLEPIFEWLLGKGDTSSLLAALDPIIRVRAVQNFTPSRATAFVLLLKPIIRDIADSSGAQPAAELQEMEDRVDELLLRAFDKFIECREKIYELKVSTERNKIYSAFSRAGLIHDLPDNGPELIS